VVALARWQARRVVNTELLRLYWQLAAGRRRPAASAQGRGTRVIDRLATDLRAAFPDMRGLSRSNIKYMRQIPPPGPGTQSANSLLANCPGATSPSCSTSSLTRRSATCAASAVQQGWSRNVLLNQIMNQLHPQSRRRTVELRRRVAPTDSELAQQLTRDPYVLNFLDLTTTPAERDLETALVDRLQSFLLELGYGFAFVGRQYHFEVDGDDSDIDPLFFNWAQFRFVVLELKIGRFQPQHTGELGFYVAWVDENLRDHDRHSPTIGILLCAGRNDNVVRYFLANTTAPLAVATTPTTPSPPPSPPTPNSPP
jgi:predicted nuclease of restriction endonuclease-like (RecB) superfamily